MSAEFIPNGIHNDSHVSHQLAQQHGLTTHDISRAGYHNSSYKEFFENVAVAIKGAYPNAGRSRYAAVHVLLLSWEDDDLNVDEEAKGLQNVLEEFYGFSTERWKIPSNRSNIQLQSKLVDFQETHDKEDNLLIVYYGGHGYLNDNRQSMWLCHRRPDAPTVKWFAHQAILEDVNSDVLILLDCCHSVGSSGGATKGTKEIIAACGFESEAPGVGRHSFTSSLIDELIYLGNGPAFTAVSLHDKVLNRVMRSWDPGYHAERFEYSDGNGRLRDRERRTTPIYRSLNGHPRQRSIEIMPLAAKHMNISSMSNSSSAKSSSQTKVAISIQFESGQLANYEDIVQWLRDMPVLAESIDLISVQQSHSMVVILALPVAVWDLLSEDPACSFVGFTTSTNLLFSIQSAPKLIAEADSVSPPNNTGPSKAKTSGTEWLDEDVFENTTSTLVQLDESKVSPGNLRPSGSRQLPPELETPKNNQETAKDHSTTVPRRRQSLFRRWAVSLKKKGTHLDSGAAPRSELKAVPLFPVPDPDKLLPDPFLLGPHPGTEDRSHCGDVR